MKTIDKKKDLEVRYILLSKEYWRIKTQIDVFEVQAKYVKSQINEVEKELEEIKKPNLKLIKR